MFLTNKDLIDLVDFRRELHRFPEISGEEKETAIRIRRFLERAAPDRVLADLGGHGVAAVYDSGRSGPSILIRSELDALPIEEKTGVAYSSTINGRGHLCGHDGHSTILTALALGLSRNPPETGRVILLFQPAEETGAGAAAVLADPRFSEIKPDFSFSLHNLPGLPLGHVSLIDGPVNCASRGLKIKLSGKTAHASMPEYGISPMQAISQLMPTLTELGSGHPSQSDFSMVTVTHASMGEAAFGISPADAEIWVTLRTLTDDRMAALCADAEALAHKVAASEKLAIEMTYDDIFLYCDNASDATSHLIQALDDEKITRGTEGLPMRGSEDFGRFRSVSSSAMFFLGAGMNSASLHNPDYDFPDELIEIGARIFMRTIRNLTDRQ